MKKCQRILTSTPRHGRRAWAGEIEHGQQPETAGGFLDAIERIGNKVPHPAVIFLILLAVVIVLSHVLHLLGHQRHLPDVRPRDRPARQRTRSAVNSLLTADGIRFLFTSMIRNFMGFGPVGVILVAMIGVGLAEQAGLVTALIKKIVSVAPGMVADLHHRRSWACCRASPPMPATWC